MNCNYNVERWNRLLRSVSTFQNLLELDELIRIHEINPRF